MKYIWLQDTMTGYVWRQSEPPVNLSIAPPNYKDSNEGSFAWKKVYSITILE